MRHLTPSRVAAFFAAALFLLPAPATAQVGLVHHFALDETTGLEAADSVGFSLGFLLNFENFDDTHWVDGQVDGALDLGVDETTDNYVEVDLAAIDAVATGGFTVALWINPGDAILSPGEYQLLSTPEDSVGFTIMNNVSEGVPHERVLLFWDGDIANLHVGTTTLEPGNWYHVAITSTGAGGEKLYYVNGVPEEQVLWVPSRGGVPGVHPGFRNGWPAGISRIGAIGAGLRTHDSVVDDVRIYDVALAPEEILELVPEPPPAPPRIDNLVPAAGENFHDPALGLHFEVNASAGATIPPENIVVILNDVDVSGDLLIEGAPEARRVSYNNLVTDTLYEAVIEATDSAGGVARAIHSFGTVSRGGGEVIDEFDEDPLADPLWELYEPEAPAIYTTDDGFFRVTIPTGVNLDHWVAADRAILLRRLDFPEDFIIETRMRIVGSGDPFAPILPPVEENYLANLMVQFSRFDAFHWGPQRGTNLASQRSGNTVPRCDAFSSLEEISLQIRKLGSTYTFSWRAADDQEWNETCSRVVSEPPLFVGLMFKTWAPLTFEQTFEFDYFKILEVPVAAPDVTVCDNGETDIAWVGMPFRRSLDVRGFPAPDVQIVSGPPGLEYSPDRGELSGWTPAAAGAVTIELAASNSQGNQSLTIPVEVLEDPRDRDDDFEDDPRESFDYWEFHEPQTGIAYELVEDGDGSTWWRLAVPQFGDLGENFDHWVTVDRAPQLRHPVVAGENFVAETRVRIVPEAAPLSPTEPFLAGLMLHFGEFDVLHWNIGQERSFALRTTNLFLERSGTNNIARGQVDEMMAGRPVQLRIERKCDDYQCFYRGDGDEEWTLAGTHTTTDEPLFVGLIMKTWAGGSTFSVDFDYFDILTPGDEPTTALFARGDADSNGAINLTDAIVILGFLFLGTAPPNCMDAADVDDSGGDRVTLTDAVVLLNWLFLGRDAPPPPSPSTATYVPADCGPDPTKDPLGCKSPAERCP